MLQCDEFIRQLITGGFVLGEILTRDVGTHPRCVQNP